MSVLFVAEWSGADCGAGGVAGRGPQHRGVPAGGGEGAECAVPQPGRS